MLRPWNLAQRCLGAPFYQTKIIPKMDPSDPNYYPYGPSHSQAPYGVSNTSSAPMDSLSGFASAPYTQQSFYPAHTVPYEVSVSSSGCSFLGVFPSLCREASAEIVLDQGVASRLVRQSSYSHTALLLSPHHIKPRAWLMVSRGPMNRTVSPCRVLRRTSILLPRQPWPPKGRPISLLILYLSRKSRSGKMYITLTVPETSLTQRTEAQRAKQTCSTQVPSQQQSVIGKPPSLLCSG